MYTVNLVICLKVQNCAPVKSSHDRNDCVKRYNIVIPLYQCYNIVMHCLSANSSPSNLNNNFVVMKQFIVFTVVCRISPIKS
jgi:hypothetical protein